MSVITVCSDGQGSSHCRIGREDQDAGSKSPGAGIHAQRLFSFRPGRTFSLPVKNPEPKAKEKDPLSLSLFTLHGPPLRPAGEPFLDCVQSVSPSGLRLCLGQDVLTQVFPNQPAQAPLVILQRGTAPPQLADQQRQLTAFQQGNQESLGRPVG
jgi:hypothetical protein